MQAQDLHLTLAFLGDCSESAASMAFADAAAEPPAACRLAVVGCKRLGGGSRSAWTLLLQDDAGLSGWVDRHRDWLLDRAGRPPEARRFLPHITLARAGALSVAASASLQVWLDRVQGIALEFDRLGLYCSARSGTHRYARHREAMLAA